MLLQDINLTTKINKLETYVRHYHIYLYVLKHLFVELNKDGSYPVNAYPRLSIEGAKLMETNTRIYGYKWFEFKVGTRSFEVCISKYDGDAHITCKETTKGAQYDCGGFAINLDYLTSQDDFNEHIKNRIALFEKNLNEDLDKIEAIKKVWKQLKKIDTYGLQNWEVKELL